MQSQGVHGGVEPSASSNSRSHSISQSQQHPTAITSSQTYCCCKRHKSGEWRCQAGKCCRRCCRKCCTAQLTGAILVLLGAACIVLAVQAPPYLTNEAERYLNSSTLLVSPQSPSYHYWQETTAQVKFYVWEVVNWYEVIHFKGWPAMTQHGPYYYNRTTRMLNVTFWNILENYDTNPKVDGCEFLDALPPHEAQRITALQRAQNEKHAAALRQYERDRAAFEAGTWADMADPPQPPAQAPEATTITFTPYTTYEYIPPGPNAPAGASDQTESLFTANLAYVTIRNNIDRMSDPVAAREMDDILRLYIARNGNGELIFQQHTPQQIIFGYFDQVLDDINHLAAAANITFYLPPNLYLVQNDSSPTDAFQLHKWSCMQTGSSPGTQRQWYNIVQGTRSWNSIWQHNQPSQGSNGFQFPVHTGHGPVMAWTNITLRQLQWTWWTYDANGDGFDVPSSETINNLVTYRYQIDPHEMMSNVSYPPNAAYWQAGPSGVFNLSSVPPMYSPLFVSYPHFFQADNQYLSRLQGVDPPDASLHANYINIEPYSGTVYQRTERYQWNVRVQRDKLFDSIQLTWIPLVWYEDIWALNPSIAADLTNGYFHKQTLAQWAMYGGWIVGAVFFFVAMILFYGVFYRYRRKQALKQKLMASVAAATGMGVNGNGSGVGGGGGDYTLLADDANANANGGSNGAGKKRRTAAREHRRQQKAAAANATATRSGGAVGGTATTTTSSGTTTTNGVSPLLSGASSGASSAISISVSPALNAANPSAATAAALTVPNAAMLATSPGMFSPTPGGGGNVPASLLSSTASAVSSSGGAPKYKVVRRDSHADESPYASQTGVAATATLAGAAAMAAASQTAAAPVSTNVTSSEPAASASIDINPNAL